MNKLRPVLNPNLPNSKVKVVAVGESYLPDIKDSFDRLGIEIDILPVPISNSVNKVIKSHADITTHHLGENNIIVSRDTYSEMQIRMNEMSTNLDLGNWNILSSYGLLSSVYPGDILLNALRIGKYLFCNATHTDVRLLEYCQNNSIEIVHVKQGYTKCSVCVVQSDAAITSDLRLAEAMVEKGIDVLRITPGYIELPGFDYGFIGGASGKIAPDMICFTGNLNYHPDRNSIYDFLINHGVRLIKLAERTCFDIGSIIPLIETVEN